MEHNRSLALPVGAGGSEFDPSLRSNAERVSGAEQLMNRRRRRIEQFCRLLGYQHFVAKRVDGPAEQDGVEHVGDQLGQLVVEVPARGGEESAVAPAITDRSLIRGKSRHPFPKRVELLWRLSREGLLVQPLCLCRSRPVSRHGSDVAPAGHVVRSRGYLLAGIPRD